MSHLDRRQLRDAFGSFMTGVTVVTATSAAGEQVGFTANSFASVSLDPPLLLVCPAKSLSSYAVFESCEHFAVSVLAEDQQQVSNTFASSKGDRFANVSWHQDTFGSPLIAGAVTQFSCSSFQRVDAGDHLVLIGRVEQFVSQEKRGLGYAKGGYFSLGMERQAEVRASEHNVQVGVLLEAEGHLLVRETAAGWSLPQTSVHNQSSSLKSLQSLLSALELEVEIGPVFSVYEKPEAGHFFAFYRAELARALPVAGYDYVSLKNLANATFATDDIAAMVKRYLQEKQSGNFRLYVGSELKGELR